LDVASKAEKKKLASVPDPLTGLAFSPDGKTLAAAGWEHAVFLFDAATFADPESRDAHRDAVKSLAFAPDGKTLATGGRDRSVLLWDPAAGKLRSRIDHEFSTGSLAFAPDGKTLATGLSGTFDDDQKILIDDVASGKNVAALVGHTRTITG